MKRRMNNRLPGECDKEHLVSLDVESSCDETPRAPACSRQGPACGVLWGGQEQCLPLPD
jgi:hypothetical protein